VVPINAQRPRSDCASTVETGTGSSEQMPDPRGPTAEVVDVRDHRPSCCPVRTGRSATGSVGVDLTTHAVDERGDRVAGDQSG